MDAPSLDIIDDAVEEAFIIDSTAWKMSPNTLRFILLSLFLAVCLSMAIATNGTKNSTSSTANNEKSHPRAALIPFIVMDEPSWRDLHVTIEKFRNDCSNLLKGLSQSLELALHSESEMNATGNNLFSAHLQRRLDRVAACLDHNERELLQVLIKPFLARLALPEQAYSNDHDDGATEECQKSSDSSLSSDRLFTMPHSFGANNHDKKNAYDCGAQVIAHLVRDWTRLGAGVRSSIYDWCHFMLERHVSKQSTVLVPGAGLGRLAYDIAFYCGYSVEANEVSLSMAAAAYAILQGNATGTLYPFALDYFANEVESERRYDRVSYPDTNFPGQTDNLGRLSYTVGDFVHIYRWQRHPGSFSCVVTCFFIDTATNIYEYLSTIHHTLASGGIWINIGPLRWHQNSMLHPAADELRQMIESSPLFSFQILFWSVDERPSEYRHQDPAFDVDGKPFVRSTSYDAYRPLRFVVKKRE